MPTDDINTPINTSPSPTNPATAPAPTNTSIMKRRILVPFVVLVLVIVIGVGIVIYHHYTNSGNSNIATMNVKVDVTSNGFVPATVDISPNTQVTWINTDSAPHQVAADPYPKDNGISGFDSTKILFKNDSTSFVFEKTGTYTYHDERNPLKFRGTVVVK